MNDYKGINIQVPKSRTRDNERDTTQPWRKNKKGKVEVNEKFIKIYGADKMPDPEIRAYYKKKGF